MCASRGLMHYNSAGYEVAGDASRFAPGGRTINGRSNLGSRHARSKSSIGRLCSVCGLCYLYLYHVHTVIFKQKHSTLQKHATQAQNWKHGTMTKRDFSKTLRSLFTPPKAYAEFDPLGRRECMSLTANRVRPSIVRFGAPLCACKACEHCPGPLLGG